jgi:hypothetical protein
MNEALALTQCGVGPSAVGDATLLGLPAERSAKQQLSGSAGELVKTIATILDQMVLGVIEKRTAQDFRAAFNQVFPAYMQLILSLSGMVSAIVPSTTLARLAAESFSELEADIREHAVIAFGADIRDRAIFTVWTLRKIADLLHTVSSAEKVKDRDRDKENEFKSYFLTHALRARLSIDCLTASMRFKRPIYPEALGVIADGLRSTVDAYAWIRQAADLHAPSDESPVTPVNWNQEDQELLNESMYDMTHEPL